MNNENIKMNRETFKLSAEALEKKRKHRWRRRIKIRAARIKKQLRLENRFHDAMLEMRTTTDIYRQSYLYWIMQQMFSLFDYETGLRAINDKAAYQSWLAENGQNLKQRH